MIGTSESATIEWKPSLSQINEIIEIIAAFSNAEGGRLFVGVSKEGIVKGISIGKDTIESLANRIAQHTEPKIHPRITVIKIEGKEIIIIDVKQSYDKLVLASGRPYVRVGKSTRQMSKDDYESLILEKHKDQLRFDDQICRGTTLKDIRPNLLKEFVTKAKAERGLDLDEKASVAEILARLKFLKNKRPTNAAVLLFGEPHDFYTQCELKCVRFKGLDVTDRILDLKPVTGSIIYQLRDAEKFIFDHIALGAWIESGKLERQEKWEYPPKAIREALANAIAHRDYWSTSKIQVRVFDDRIEVWNPGVLPKGWTAETLKKKHESKPFNPLIAEAFFWIKYIEEMGTGTNKIVQWCREWGLPEPEFEYTGTAVVVTLKKAPEAVQQEAEKGKEKSKDKGKEKSTEKILRLIAKNPKMTIRELADDLDFSLAGIEKVIRTLKKQGRLSRMGPDKGGHWEVRDQ